jgi:uncharacterized protein (DUF4415 family)
MSAKSKNTPQNWVDHDEAPELDEEFFDKGVWKIGERVVSRDEGSKAAALMLRRGRPKAEQTKLSLTVRYDADIIAAFKATGAGWQSRMNAALREWLKTHNPA